MELLERDGALATLRGARDAAAGGDGRVVFVTGEPGIGKTSLVTRFVRAPDVGGRVLVGTCDDLAIPRPLGPFQDLVGSVSAPLEKALLTRAATHEVQDRLIAELGLAPGPTVLVLEDVHWADDATLDSITVLGRRIGTLPALLILTFRSGEAAPGHRLHATVGAIPADHSVVLELAPLSERAVAALAGDDAREVYAATSGNPFYVTELLGSRSAAGPPASVANAVLGRASRLGEEARRLVELVAVVPTRAGTALLDVVMPDWHGAAVEPERRQLLEVDTKYVRFRHALAQDAIRSSLPVAVRGRLHRTILAALLAAHADPADILHHAEAAGADDVVADHAAVAARRAAAQESNREAYIHYRRAADFADRLPAPERATLLEELGMAAYVVGRVAVAVDATIRARDLHRELGDATAVGRCTRVLSRLHWYAGDGGAARVSAMEAISILEPLGESVELARAYSGLSQLGMLADDDDVALAWGERAIALATRLGDARTRAHALVNIGTTRLQGDHRHTATLLEAHAIADAAGDRHEAARALGNIAYLLMSWVRPDEAVRYARQALDYSHAHEMPSLASYDAVMLAWLRLRAGEWAEAEQVARAELERGTAVPQLLARTVLAELAVRRGDADAGERLRQVAGLADRAGEPQRVVPVLELATEHALITGGPMPTEQFATLLQRLGRRGRPPNWAESRAAGWAAVVGLPTEVEPATAPYAAMARRDWRSAADAFGEVGWSYDRALLLSLLDDEASLGEAIGIARRLGAEPLTRRVAGRMRERGFRVPQGPREATRGNAAGLTARQLDVLSLLVEGHTNAVIAERLFVSLRTAESHVAAVLAKLDVPTRAEAARRAAELRLIPGS